MNISKLNSKKWKSVLLEIYRSSPNGYIETHNSKFTQDNHPLAIKLKISGLELSYSIGFLRENKLINKQKPFDMLDSSPLNPNYIEKTYITKKGFNLAFEIEKQIRGDREKKRFEQLQILMVILTVILAFTGIINIFLHYLIKVL